MVEYDVVVNGTSSIAIAVSNFFSASTDDDATSSIISLGVFLFFLCGMVACGMACNKSRCETCWDRRVSRPIERCMSCRQANAVAEAHYRAVVARDEGTVEAQSGAVNTLHQYQSLRGCAHCEAQSGAANTQHQYQSSRCPASAYVLERPYAPPRQI